MRWLAPFPRTGRRSERALRAGPLPVCSIAGGRRYGELGELFPGARVRRSKAEDRFEAETGLSRPPRGLKDCPIVKQEVGAVGLEIVRRLQRLHCFLHASRSGVGHPEGGLEVGIRGVEIQVPPQAGRRLFRRQFVYEPERATEYGVVIGQGTISVV